MNAAPRDEAYAAMKAAGMTEKNFQAIVVAAAKRDGWLVYHTHDSRRSEPGFPDLVLVHRDRQLVLFRELKTQKGKPTAAQTTWLHSLTFAGHDAKIWRPYDWFIGDITNELDGINR